ncbi:dynein light chain Tctex-type protein 2B-like [Diadema antillarum]|uniref:dynein light chain Tctex-type protein 2B-like n=1 Tax=Diadema antillarum TaxID=105358 RepID=UPI003A8687AC
MDGFQHRLDAIASESQRKIPLLRARQSIPTGQESREGRISLDNRRQMDRLLKPAASTSKGRSVTFSDVASESDANSVATSTNRRAPAAQAGLVRERAGSQLNMKRGSTLYFGKDITTSMWWKCRQIYDGVGALRGKPETCGETENSYRLEPRFGHKFAPGKVEECIRQVLDSLFVKETYNPKTAAVLAEAISDTVKQRVKSLSTFERYRFVVNVDIGSRMPGQEIVFASRYLWNTDTDGFATVTDQNKTMYVIVTVYGIYLD